MFPKSELLTYVLAIECDPLAEWATLAAYILTLRLSCDCQHGKSSHLGLIGREAARMAGAPTTVGYGPADHAYEVTTSAEGPVGRSGQSGAAVRERLFRAITVLAGKGLNVA